MFKIAKKDPKVAVVFHGYSLNVYQATLALWVRLIWGIMGSPEEQRMGRLAMAVFVALKKGASLLIIGTGATVLNDQKEADFIIDYLFKNFHKLAQFKAFEGVDLEKAEVRIREIIYSETNSINTTTAVKESHLILHKGGYIDITGVTCFLHAPRNINESFQSQFETWGYGSGVIISTTYSEISWVDGKVPTIFEPSSDSKGTNAPEILVKFFSLSLRGKKIFLFFAKFLLKILRIF